MNPRPSIRRWLGTVSEICCEAVLRKLRKVLPALVEDKFHVGSEIVAKLKECRLNGFFTLAFHKKRTRILNLCTHKSVF
jgi:hypothetical protein